jgi:DNA-binding FadR family transcriptional regulator
MGETIKHRRKVDAVGWARLSHLVVIDNELSDGAVRLYARLLWYARQAGNCWPGRDRLAEDLRVSEPTIRRRLSELVARGLITRRQRMNTTAVTILEDLETVYGAVDNFPSPSNLTGTVPVKNDPDMSPSNLTHKEETEEETSADDVDNTTEQNKAFSVSVLRAAGVIERVARELAAEHDLERVEAVIEHAQAKADDNPAGLIVWMLRNGADVPKRAKKQSEETDPHRRFLSGAYADLILS